MGRKVMADDDRRAGLRGWAKLNQSNKLIGLNELRNTREGNDRIPRSSRLGCNDWRRGDRLKHGRRGKARLARGVSSLFAEGGVELFARPDDEAEIFAQ